MFNIMQANSVATEATMTSLELLEVINQHRQAVGKRAMRHNDFMEKIRIEFGETTCAEISADAETVMPTGGVRRDPCYKLTQMRALRMGMRESVQVRGQVCDWIENRLRQEAIVQVSTGNAFLDALNEAQRQINANAQQLTMTTQQVQEHSETLAEHNQRLEEIIETVQNLEQPEVQVPQGYATMEQISHEIPWMTKLKIKATLDGLHWPSMAYTARGAGYVNPNARAYKIERGETPAVRCTIGQLFAKIRQEARPVGTAGYYKHRLVPNKFMMS